jgi:membrane associated rhomboid family serine protease
MNPYRHLTIIGLILLSATVSAGEPMSGISWAESYGAVPSIIVPAFRKLCGGEINAGVLRPLTRLVTAIFVHGGPEHLIYNMLFLWTFGYLTSQFLGQWWALAIFLVCGVCGNVVQVWLGPESPIPIIGASGAICGFAGVYLALALRWQLPWPEVWPLAHPIPPLQLGAVAVIGFIGDIYFLASHGEGIAYGAHIGGLLSGFAIASLMATIYPTLRAYERAGLKK